MVYVTRDNSTMEANFACGKGTDRENLLPSAALCRVYEEA